MYSIPLSEKIVDNFESENKLLMSLITVWASKVLHSHYTYDDFYSSSFSFISVEHISWVHFSYIALSIASVVSLVIHTFFVKSSEFWA